MRVPRCGGCGKELREAMGKPWPLTYAKHKMCSKECVYIMRQKQAEKQRYFYERRKARKEAAA